MTGETSTRPVGVATSRPASGSPRAALAVAMLGFFVVALDSQVVNVALPTIRDDLGGNLSALQWVVTGYTLSFSALLLFGGTFSERIGARRAYGVGMVLFVVASALCGLAPNLVLLVVARILQGVGAALITPTSLALIRQEFTDAAARTRAIAYWAMGGSVAAAAGPILGGVLAQVDWRWIFLLNLPVGVVALLALSRVGDSPRRIVPFDTVGQVAAVVALAALTFAVIEGADLGYGSTPVLVAYALTVLAAMVFLRTQVRGAHPMVPLDLFRSRRVAVSLVAAFMGMVGFYGLVFVQGLYFQQARGLDPLTTGLLFLPMTGLVALLNPLAARVALRFGPVVPIVGGQLVLVAGLVGLVLAPATTAPWAVAVLMIPVGVGGSFTVPPLTTLLLDAVPAERAGTASGVLNTARQVGGSLGVAAVGAVLASQADLLHGQRIALSAVAVLVAATAALSLTLHHPSRPTKETP
ncbi:MFS transporter [Cellulomonas soli]|uniref:MFS transporter n=1 Tax=Cellulomonas soli TaxID=931535 RepID=A0A512PDB1_9CELL|nr:MFS transporter [Cellulomonas soli]NYI60201.1 DHA2 family methylenomycin A resistance protein-like MFS transporter [Cellulomonas soli]GEP69146.1 MFS transporter [Cellulomonas soli]